MAAVLPGCTGSIATCSAGTVARRSNRPRYLQPCNSRPCQLSVIRASTPCCAYLNQSLACSSVEQGAEVASRHADMHPQTGQPVPSTTHQLSHKNLQQPINEEQQQEGLAMWLVLASWQLWAPTAVQAAEETGLAYNPTGGEEFFKNVAGAAYIVLVGVFLFRVLTRRAKRAREERIAGSQGGANAAPEQPSIFEQLRVQMQQSESTRQPGPLDAFLGAAQAGLLAAGLFIFSDKMQTVMDATQLPDGYTARNISITVRTILLGLCWLATFIFAANSLGLLGLTFQWLLFPDSMKDDAEEAARKAAAAAAQGPQLPKVGVSSKPDELRRAFQMAETLGKREGAAAAAASVSSSGSVSDTDSSATSATEPSPGSRL